MDLLPSAKDAIHWELGYYYGSDMGPRTKRCLKRRAKREGTPAVRPLLVPLTEVLQRFQQYVEDVKVKKRPSALELLARREFLAEEKRLNLEADGCSMDDSFDLQDCYNTIDNGYGEGTLHHILSTIVNERVPSKARYVTRKLVFESEHKVRMLLDCPDMLEREIDLAFEASKRMRENRRKRSRRGGKRHNRAAKRIKASEKSSDGT